MIDDSLYSLLPDTVVVVPNALMSNYTTFQLGGCCPALINCTTASGLVESALLLVNNGVDFIVIGQGSNLLVSDAGLQSIVLRYCSEEQPAVEFQGTHVHVSGCTLLDDLVRLATESGAGDISFCSGIPGTVGGAIAGNAGAFGQQIGDVVVSVRLMDLYGQIHWVTASDLAFAYRSSVLKQTGAVVLDAELALNHGDHATIKAERERILALRRAKHPDWKTTPCAGSIFRNIEPTSAAERRQAAGWFLEQAGAKNFRVGGARLYEKHANIIIAEPDAKASDVYQLSEKMAEVVHAMFGFDLIREVKLLGAF